MGQEGENKSKKNISKILFKKMKWVVSFVIGEILLFEGTGII